MFHLSKKVAEHLLIIFFLGGIFGIIDGRNNGGSQFIGNGIAMIFIAMLIGTIISFITNSLKLNKQSTDTDETILDTDFESKNKEINYFTLNKYKCGVYVALFFVVFSFLGELKYYLLNSF